MAMIEKWKYLPEGILMDVLTWLPVKSVLRFRCVSKNLCNHFTNPDFIKTHTNHSNQMNHSSIILSKQKPSFYDSDEPYTASFPSLDYNITTSTFDMSVEYQCPFHYWKFYIHILGICNGLVCLQSDPALLCIWNPITNEYKKIPEIPDLPSQTQSVFSVPAHGFGYDCKTGNYKVVKIITAGSDRFSQVRVYTLGTDSLRVLENVPYVFLLLGRANGLFLNGALHWLVHPCNRCENPIRVILCFNVGDEKFREIQLPIPLCGAPEGEDYYKSSIGLLDGKLCLSWYVSGGNVDVWVMQNYGVIESWTKLFSVSRLKEDIELVRPLQSCKNGDILLFGQPLNCVDPHNGDLILYDPMKGNARFTDTSSYQAHTYVGSLVSVKSICDASHEVVEQAILQ